MWKAMVAGLLSMTALVPPASAQDDRSMDRGTWRRERAERPSPPSGAVPRPAPGERVGQAPRPAPERWDRGGGRRDPRADDTRPAPGARGWDDRRDDPGRRDRGVPRPPVVDDRRDADRRDRGWDDRPRLTPPDRVWRSERAEPRRRFGGFDRPAPPSAVWRSGRDGRWDRDWRRDPRYDWNRYRAERGAAFRLPRYYAPYGWNDGYRRFGVGVPLAPMLYAPRYWIYDPYAYRLPDAGEPYRWIRYYDDALLVDIENGTVVDVIHGIFG